jgi:hypothetical protein
VAIGGHSRPIKFTAKVTTSKEWVKPARLHLGLDREVWAYRFCVDGRTYTLRKREPSPEAAWYLATIIRGQRIERSLETCDAAVAAKLAASNFIRPARSGRWAEIAGNKARRDFATIGKLLATYKEIARGLVSPWTIENNVGAFHLMVLRGLGKDEMSDEEVNEKSTALLTGQLVSEFEVFMSRAAVAAGRKS